MFLRRALLLLVAVTSVAGLHAASFHDLLDRYYEELLELSPVEAAGNGDSDKRYEHIWPNDISAEYRAKDSASTERYLAGLAGFDRAALSSSDQLSYDVLKWTLETRRFGLTQPTHLLPINQFYSGALTFAQMGSGSSIHPFKTEQDFRNFISRAHGFAAWADTAIANMREGLARGITQPRILMERTLPQYEPLMADDPEKNIFFAPLKQLPVDLAPAAAEKLADDYRAAIRDVIIPAYARLHAFIEREYLPECRASAGIGAVPGGAEIYAYLIQFWTTTNLMPDEIHELGRTEVARIRAEMEKVQAQVGFKGTLFEFLNFVATDPQFAPFTTDEEVLDAYRAIEARLASQVPHFFGRVPRTPFEIRATEKFRAATASAEYMPAADDGSRPGIFYVPIVDPRENRTPRMENLFLHEAIPGHHFQIALTLENKSLPRFRRFGWNSAYVEGWALYTESLGKELGLYTDPYQYLGMLLGDMHRAVRLVLDTGLHAKGWSREQALAYIIEQEGGDEEKHRAEVERYMAIPAQALSYKLGQLKILELRARAEKELGAKWDIRAFHDHLLEEGSLPLAILETRFNAWLERRK
mgnify:CR=1 FL=1|jgi:Uncharacterized protein conserved in bacteria